MQKKYQSYLTILFWVNIVLMPIILLVLLYIKGSEFGNVGEGSIVFERYAIILTLIGIPLALKWHHSQMQKIRKENDIESVSFAKKSMMSAVLRVFILNLVIAVNLVGFYLFEAPNFIYMSIITIFALLLTFPGKRIWEEVAVTENNENNIKE